MTTGKNVLSYIAEPIGSFWDWSIDGEVVQWSSGRTLAFRKEIAAVATYLSPLGLPSFSALLLFIGACHNDWGKSIAERNELADHLREYHPSRHLITLARERLDAISELPQQYRKGPDSIARLAEFFFEDAFVTLPSPESKSAAEMLSTILDPSDLDDHRPGDVHHQAEALLSALTKGRGVPPPDKLALLLRTSLEELPAPATIPTPQAARTIIASLRSQRETAGLGRLAHQLLAAVSVPRALATAEELPLGGFSDISNRGPLDRLLITELVHDDLTLAVRVATNEALYVRRERPPARPPQRRALFIDNTIRLWGAPRIFATAVGLAFAGTADPHADFHAHRPLAAGATPTDLLSREGLIAHLESLETAPHAGPAVESWLAGLDKLSAARADAILITADTAFADSDFTVRLSRSLEKLQSDLTLFVATVSRSGAFVFLQFSRAGRKIISQATLDLADILDINPIPAPPAPKRIAPVSTDKPVILSIHPLPLLAPWSIEPTRSAGTVKKGAVCLTSDRRVLHWANADSYARELALEAPRGAILAALHDAQTDSAVFVIKSPRADCITVFIVDPPGTRQLSLPTDFPPVGACVHQGIVYLIYKTRIAGFELGAGKSVGQIDLPNGARWHGEQYFLLNSIFLTLAYDGARIDLVAIPGESHPQTCAVTQFCGVEGPVLQKLNGRLALPAHTPENDRTIVPPFMVAREPAIVATSPAKDRILICVGTDYFMVNAAETPPRWRESGAWNLQSIRLHPTCPRNNVSAIYRHFKYVYINSDGEFTLVNRRGRHYALSKHGARGTYIGMADKGKLQLPGNAVSFEHFSSTRSFTLHRAGFPRGAVFLDSRGLLHIVPADVSLPQLALVLCDFQVPLWTSDGQTAGFEHFFAGMPTIPAEQAGEFIRDQLARAAEAIG